MILLVIALVIHLHRHHPLGTQSSISRVPVRCSERQSLSTNVVAQALVLVSAKEETAQYRVIFYMVAERALLAACAP